jgi:hypothetical protein
LFLQQVDIDMCVPSTTLIAFMLRWMLVWEERDADTVWLLKAAPRRLYQQSSLTYLVGNLADEMQTQDLVNVRAAPTRFGDISYTLGSVHGMASENASAMFLCNVTLGLHGRGFVNTHGLRVVMRLRDPNGQKAISSAAISSSSNSQVAVAQVDKVAETVTVEVPRQLIARGRTTKVSFSVVVHFA